MLKYYTDANIRKAIADQLRKNGVDCIRCEEIGMADVSDVEHLEYAAKENRVLVSFDQDMAALHKVWMEAQRSHAGIAFVQHYLQGEKGIGVIVKTLIEWHQLDDLKDQLKFIT